MVKPGDQVKIITRDKEYNGILMPNQSESSIFIKLNSGYNMGILKNEIKKMELTKKQIKKTTKIKKPKPKKGLKTITILHTGGTIASKVEYETGGVIAQFSDTDLLEIVPELFEIANIKSELVVNIMSEDIAFSDYHNILKFIKKNAKNSDGFIIGHGTDTLAYTSAALSFALEKINIPIILVGSQRSSDRAATDAAANLICAAKFIANTNFVGVAICMHNSSSDDECAILSGTKARKMHTSRRDAFKVVNDIPIALINYKTSKISFKKKDYSKKTKENKIDIKEKFSNEVALLKIVPNLSFKLLKFYTENFKGIIVEGTGMGHIPTNVDSNLKNYEILKSYIKKGGIVGISTQTLFGRVHPFAYTNLRRLSNIGCIFCEDMLPETAYIKLSWLLGNYKSTEAKELLPKNLRGEITQRSEYEVDFLD